MGGTARVGPPPLAILLAYMTFEVIRQSTLYKKMQHINKTLQILNYNHPPDTLLPLAPVEDQ